MIAASGAVGAACNTVLSLGDVDADTEAAAPTPSGNGDGGGPTVDAAKDAAADASAGDRAVPRLVFVTARVFQGDLGGSSGADALCNAEAESNGMAGRTFTAYVLDSDGGGSPAGRLTDGGWSRIDGVVAFTASPRAQNPAVPLALTADAGVVEAGARVWTGLQTFGPSTNCGAGGSGNDIWTSSSAGANAGYGDPTRNDGAWSRNGNSAAPCDQRLHLYCFER